MAMQMILLTLIKRIIACLTKNKIVLNHPICIKCRKLSSMPGPAFMLKRDRTRKKQKNDTWNVWRIKGLKAISLK
jgi:hypothetical protein